MLPRAVGAKEVPYTGRHNHKKFQGINTVRAVDAWVDAGSGKGRRCLRGACGQLHGARLQAAQPPRGVCMVGPLALRDQETEWDASAAIQLAKLYGMKGA